MYSLKSKRHSVKLFKVFACILICLFFYSAKRHSYKTLTSKVSGHLGLVKLRIENNNTHFSTDIYFNTNASLGLDPGYDASLFGGVAPDFSVYSLLVEDNTGMPMGIQALGGNDMNGTIVPIGIHAFQGDLITVQISENTIPQSVNVYFEDSLTNTLTLLNSNTYQFVANEAIEGTGRFYLRFGADVLSNNERILDELSIHFNNERQQISIDGQLKDNTSVNFYDINGRLTEHLILNNTTSNNILDVSNLVSGIYVIALISKSNYRRTQKILIN